MKIPRDFHEEFKDGALEAIAYLGRNHIARMESHTHPDCNNPLRRFVSIRFIVENSLVLKEMLDYYSSYLFGHGARVTTEYKFNNNAARCIFRITCDKDLPADLAEAQLEKALAQLSPAVKHYRADHKYKES